MATQIFILYLQIISAAPYWPGDWNDAPYELQASINGGGPIGYLVAPDSRTGSVLPALGRFALRGRFPAAMNLGVEIAVVFPRTGFDAVLLVDIIRQQFFRLHLDLGWHYNLVAPQTVSRLDRPWDLVGGVGAEILVGRIFGIHLDWRVYLPGPTAIPSDEILSAYREATIGGILQFGLAFVW